MQISTHISKTKSFIGSLYTTHDFFRESWVKSKSF